jgi:hypothetical protein
MTSLVKLEDVYYIFNTFYHLGGGGVKMQKNNCKRELDNQPNWENVKTSQGKCQIIN